MGQFSVGYLDDPLEQVGEPAEPAAKHDSDAWRRAAYAAPAKRSDRLVEALL
jgi:hypothetical protein